MAYFACAEAAKTGTDSATRKSIASGSVSPTYVSTVTGKTHFRGVVQLDAITGRNMDYVTSSDLAQRSASAKAINQAEKSAAAKARATVHTPAQAFVTDLHETPPGTIATTNKVSLKLGAVAAVIGAVIIGYMVMR